MEFALRSSISPARLVQLDEPVKISASVAIVIDIPSVIVVLFIDYQCLQLSSRTSCVIIRFTLTAEA